MLIKRRLILASILLLYSVISSAQVVPSPTDTTYIMTLLKKAETIEMQQPEKALQDYRRLFRSPKKLITQKAILRVSG